MKRPSDLLRALLEWSLGPDGQDAIGDLEEELRTRIAPTSSWWRRELWYAREATSLLVAVWRADGRAVWKTDTRKGGGMMGGTGMDGMGRDVRHAVRSLLGEPGTTLTLVVTLAVAVGATTAIFGVANAAFLRPLPYPAADRMVRVYTGFQEDPDAAYPVSPLDWRDFDGFETVVEATAVWGVDESVHMTDGDRPSRLVAPRASASLFDVLGAEPVVGRFFTADAMVPGQDGVVVLSHGLWVRSFGADPGVVGRTVILDGRSHRVAGVAPERGMLPRDADLWRPLALGPEWYQDERWGWQFLEALVRLTPGTDVGTAARALNARLAEATDRAERLGQTRVVRSLYDERSSAGGPAILLLLAAVALVLAMACANVMNVMLARSETRRREFGLRRALGAGGGRLARLVLTETLLIALLGGLGGLFLAQLGLEVLAGAGLDALGPLLPVGIDLRVLGFGLLLTLATAVSSGTAPLLGAMRSNPRTILEEGSARAGGSRRAQRVRDGLVVLQVATAVTLLVAVGVSASAFRALVTKDPGFDPDGVLTATVELPPDWRSEEADPADFYRRLIDRLATIPGVRSAGAVNFLPLEGIGWSSSIELVNPDPEVTDTDPGGNMRPVTPGYFSTLGIPLVEGRRFTFADGPDAGPVVIVDETMARLFWPNGSPVGRQLVVGGLARSAATIVGVVGDVPDESLDRRGSGHVYFPVLQSPQRRMTVVLAADGVEPTALAPALRATVEELEPRIPVTDVVTLETRVRESLAGPRVGLLLLVSFGVVAALLAAVGIYGVLAFTTARRTGEIGTRIALGAAPRTVLAGVVGQAMRLWLVGVVMGLVGAAAGADLLGRYLSGVDPGEVTAYVAAVIVLGLVALVAASLPARRATRIDPVEALRVE